MKPQLLTGLRRLSLLPALLVLGLAQPTPAQTVAETHPLQDIAEAAEGHARSLLQEQNLDDAEVTASALDARLKLKLCGAPLETFVNGTAVRGGRLTVGVRCAGDSPWTLYVPVAIVAHTSIVVIDGPLPRGTLLNATHLHMEQRSLTALPPQYIASPDQVVGRELSRALNASTIATPSMLQTRDLVAKGQDVVILAQGANIQVRMAGVALEKGQQGERIDVQNSTSGRTIQAVILDGGTVQVQL